MARIRSAPRHVVPKLLVGPLVARFLKDQMDGHTNGHTNVHLNGDSPVKKRPKIGLEDPAEEEARLAKMEAAYKTLLEVRSQIRTL